MPAYARVIVDVAPDHLDRPFDYLIPEASPPVAVGQRVRVVFAGRRRDGWVVELGEEPSLDAKKVRPLVAIHGHDLRAEDLPFYRWVANRYAAPLASVLRHAVPPRSARAERAAAVWQAPSRVDAASRPPCATPLWRNYDGSSLLNAVWGAEQGAWYLRPLPHEDRAGLIADLVARVLAAGRGAVVIAPDPASPMLDVARALDPSAADYRDEEGRYEAFLRARGGHARIVVGERSAVFAPVTDLGLVVVDDEASPAYKERRSPRHHARDVALARARFCGAVCVLVGELPSSRLWRLLADGHVRAVQGQRGVERSRTPLVHVADLSDPRPGARRTRFHDRAAKAIREAVGHGGVAVVLTGRRGEGTAFACRSCGLRRPCPVCEGPVGLVRGTAEQALRWECAICNWEGPPYPCPSCQEDAVAPLAAGAARLADELRRSHPAVQVERMEGFDAPGPQGRPAIAVMTRGSVVQRPRWLDGGSAESLVVPDVDRFLARPSVEAAEDSLRLWLAAAQWASHVVLQTREPAHPAVQALVRWDPMGFWQQEAERRAALGFPPACHLIGIRAPITEAGEAARLLREALPADDVILGPDPEGAMLVQSGRLWDTLEAIGPLRVNWAKANKKVRIDVDPDPIG